MRVVIYRITLKNLRNSEYTMFVSQLVAIFLKYQPELLHLKKAFDRLLAMMPSLDKVRAQELSSALSNNLRDMDNERDTLYNAIEAQVKTLGKLKMPSFAQYVLTMNRFLDTHGRDIDVDSYNAQTKRTIGLFEDYDAKAEVQTAVEGLGLKMMFDHLRALNTEFAGLFLQRTAEDAEDEKVDTVGIRRETDQALLAFFEAFEFCSLEYDELDYQTPANEMNNLISYYKTQLKARITRRSNGKDVSTENPLDAA